MYQYPQLDLEASATAASQNTSILARVQSRAEREHVCLLLCNVVEGLPEPLRAFHDFNQIDITR